MYRLASGLHVRYIIIGNSEMLQSCTLSLVPKRRSEMNFYSVRLITLSVHSQIEATHFSASCLKVKEPWKWRLLLTKHYREWLMEVSANKSS